MFMRLRKLNPHRGLLPQKTKAKKEITKMTQSTLIQNIETLINNKLISEADLTDAINAKLQPLGVNISASASPIASAVVTAKPAKAAKAAKPVKADKPAVKRERTDYADGRTNQHAILLAVHNLGDGGGQSAAMQEELKKLNHEMESAVFNTTKSNMKNKYKLLKSSGKKREEIITLTVLGKKKLASLEEAATAKAAD